MATPSKPVAKTQEPYPGCDELDVALAKEIEASPAVTNIALAAKLGIGRETVAKRRGRQEFREFFAERNLPPRDFLKAYRRTAARILVTFLLKPDAKKPEMQLRAAERILGEELEPEQGASAVQSAPIPAEVAAGLGAYFHALAGATGPGRSPDKRAAGRTGNRRRHAPVHGEGTP